MSPTEQDHYQSYPGYTFSHPGQSLEVIWTPGIVNPDNSQLIAGTNEGTWKVNSNRVASRSGGRRKNNNGLWFLGGVLLALCHEVRFVDSQRNHLIINF